MIFRILLLCLFILNAGAQEKNKYIWPTDASHHLTSSFCEYRPGHYHSAIDIKTWNKEGYPIYAISDGFIYKIRVSPFGYGKVIYLLLDDGNYAVYAHLQRFNPELEQLVKSVQLSKQRYTINWMPDSIRVKKGELLGYTGQTGIGSPHLHFEIRDPYERPMNPLRFYDKVKDTRSPVLRSLLVIPLSPESRVNGSAVEQDFPLSWKKNNIYKIEGKIKAHGKIGLAITGFDQANGVGNKFAFYKTILEINDKPVFYQQYDLFDFAITNEVDIEIFYPQKARNNIVYHKLFIEPYNQLPFYDRSLGSGIIDMEKDTVDFRIVVSDFNRNKSKIVGTIINDNTKTSDIRVLNRDKEFIYLYLRTPYNLEKMEFFTSVDQNNWQPVNQFEIYERELQKSHQQFLIRLTMQDTLQRTIKSVISHQGEELTYIARINSTFQSETIQLQTRNLGKSILLDFSSIDKKSGISLILENHHQTQTIIPEENVNQFQYVIPGEWFGAAPLNVKLINQQTTMIDTLLQYQKLLPNKYQTISFFRDSLQIFSRPQSVYDTLLFDIKQSAMDLSDHDIKVLSPVYLFNSAFQALKQGVDITFKLDSIYVKPDQIGIYNLNKKDELELIESHFDTSKNQITGRLESFGEYFVAADTSNPELEIVNLKNNQVMKSLNKIQFTALDKQSGIGDDRNLSVTVDKRFVVPEWDPERNIITGNLHWQPEKGIHNIVIEVKDLAGNKSMQAINVIVE